jgi:hypothetical protein
MYNPSLIKESRYEPAAVIPLKRDSSLLDWLSATGRLIPREREEGEGIVAEDAEISDLIDVDDQLYEEDDEVLSGDNSDLDVERD